MGHSVNPEVNKSRYYRSLENLKGAILLSNSAYC
jgi:predicted ABC-type ATPase